MKNILLKYGIFLIFLFVLSNESFAQTDREFWFAAPDFTSGHGGPNGDEPIYLRFATFDVSADVKVEIPAYNGGTGYIIDEFTMGVQDYYSIDLSAIKSLVETNHPIDAPPYETGIKITSTNLISVYYEFDSFYNQDIFSLKGKNALGKKFIAPMQTLFRNDWAGYNPDPLSTINIVATGDATTVRIKLSNADMEGHAAGSTFDINLDEGETYVIKAAVAAAAGHLGGTTIEVIAGDDIAVTVNDDSAFNTTGTCRDDIGDQIVPTDVPGKEYIVMRGPLPSTERAFVYPVVDGTEVWVDGASIGTFDITNPAVVVIPSGSNAVHIEGDTSLYVFHVTGMSCEIGGALLPTTDGCTGSLQVTYYRSNGNDFWMFLMTKAGNEDAFVIEYIDGTTFNIPPGWFTPVGTTGWMVLDQANYMFADARGGGIQQGEATKIINTKDVFHMGVLNGRTNTTFKYGYFSDFVQETVSGKVVESSSAFGEVCENNPLQLFASGGKSYSWSPVDYLDDPTIATPTVTLPAGVHNYAVTIERPCTGDTTLNMQINSIPTPDASFTLSDYSVCAPFNLELYNNSDPVSDKQNWNFNYDNNPFVFDTITNDPVDTITHWFYNNTNHDTTFNIRLLTKQTGNPCVDTFFNQIHVKPEIHAGFDQDNIIGCNPMLVQFTDTSYGNLDKYKWFFGDGAQETIPSPQHEYKHVLTNDTVHYGVELVVTSPYFCRDTARKTLSVFPYLEGGFTIDVDEGCSPLNVRIEDVSAGADTIFVDFGDGTDTVMTSFSSIIHEYRNNDGVDEVDTNIIVMRVKNDEGCEFVDRDTVLVYPEFVADYTIDGPGDYEGCNARTVTFTNTTNDGTHVASRYLWEFADGTSMDTTNIAIDKFYNNTTSGNKTYDFRLTARSQYGCTDDTINTVTIYRAFANFTVDNSEGCSPLDVRVTNISIGDQIDTWNWDYGDGVGTSTNENPFQYTYNNNGTVNDTNYLVLEVSEPFGGCSTTDTTMIVVYPEVQVSYVENHTTVPGCDSLLVEFNSTLSNPALPNVTYEWNFGDGGSSSAADTTHVYKNLLSSTSQNRAVSLRAETDMGCYDVATSNITVHPMVNARIFTDKSSGCSPLTVDVNAQTYPGISNYSWDYGDGSGSSSNQNPTPYPYPANQSYLPQPGGDDNYELILEVDGSASACVDRDTVDITIYSEIVADFIPDVTSGCNPLTVNFTDNSSVNADAWNWDFDDGSTSSTQNTQNTFVNTNPFTQPFDVTLDVTSDRGCTNSTVQQINVLPFVESDFDINISEGCSPLTVTITNNSLSSGTEWYWYWDKDDQTVNAGVLAAADSANNFASFTKTFVNNSGGTRTDSLTLIVGNGNGCYEMFKRAITVHSTIDAEFDVDADEGCNSLSVQFTNNTVNGSTYNWNFGDGSSAASVSPNHVFTNTTTNDKPFTVRLIAESAEGCVDTEDTVITVYSKVISDFSMANSEGCPPFTTTIENTSIGNATNNYQWYIDNVAVATAPNDKSDFDHIYENTNTVIRPYEVKLIATNSHGCTSEHTDIVTVYEYVEASFSMDVNNGCTPLNVDFADLSSVPANTKYTWNFGDGASSGLSDPDHTFYNSSRTSDLLRTIKLTVQSENYCSDDTSLTVDIYHQPLAKFYIDKTSSCPPLQSTLTKLSEGEDSFEWRFGDGNTNTTDADLSYIWDNTDIDNIQYYNLELWVGTNNNCVDSTSLDLSVFPKVIADFSIGQAEGCSPLEDVQFTNESTTPATQFFWSFGDGSTTNLEDPTHDFANVGITDRTYDIYFRASSEYNCWDTITKQVKVFIQPDAEFYIDPKLMTFPDNIVGIENKTNTGTFDYYWEFGDINLTSSTVEDPSQFEYEHWGEKIIELSVSSQTNSDCFDYYTDTLTILPPKVNADFVTNRDGGCVNNGLEIEFTAAGSVYNEEYLYKWDFGDGTSAEGQYVTHTYTEPGAYYVQLTARSQEYSDLEEDYAYKTIYAYANPEVNFEVSPKIAMLNSKTLEARIKFYNLSDCNDTTGCVYTWDFGDGNSANSRDVTHGYTEMGKFDVSLTAVSAHGCRDSLILFEEVEIIGAGQIAYPNAFTPDGYGPPENETFKPLSEGVIEYELLIYNRWGELIFTTKDLNVGWDGTINGEPAKPDVYVWKAQGKFTNGRSFELAGDVTLIR